MFSQWVYISISLPIFNNHTSRQTKSEYSRSRSNQRYHSVRNVSIGAVACWKYDRKLYDSCGDDLPRRTGTGGASA